MKGIRIKNKKGVELFEIDYEFHEIIDPIKNYLLDCFWVFNNVAFKNKSKDGETFNQNYKKPNNIIIDEFNDTKLACKNFFIEKAKFVQGDWDIIIAIKNEDDFLQIKSLNYENIVKCSKAIFVCTDSAFWEVYSLDVNILQTLDFQFIK